jgi:Sap, sulfolipid-1-addressing protein
LCRYWPRRRGGRTAQRFLLGWIVGLAVVGTVLLLVANRSDASNAGAPAVWVSLLKLVLGLLLLVLALKYWRGRPRGDEEPKQPAWLQTIDTFSPAKSAGMAVLLSLNPKNLILTFGATAEVAQTGASPGAQAAALVVFILIATLGVAVPNAIYFLMGDRATTILDGIQQWMARENATIVSVLCLIIGAKLIGDAISALAT